MELHLALRNIIKTDGPSIITEGRLINVLNDFQAFDSIPASRYVIRSLIEEGYTKKLLQYTKWDTNAQHLSEQFASSTGFQLDIISTIFQSLAYGLGWINTFNNQVPPPSNMPTQNHSKPQAGKCVSNVNDLDKLVEIKTEGFASRGFNISNVSFAEEDYNILLYAELNGKKKKDCPSVHAAIYCNSKIISQETVYYQGPFEIVTWYFDKKIKKRISEISRIIIYATD